MFFSDECPIPQTCFSSRRKKNILPILGNAYKTEKKVFGQASQFTNTVFAAYKHRVCNSTNTVFVGCKHIAATLQGSGLCTNPA